MDPNKTSVFDIASLDATDEAEMEVLANGRPSGWIWRFAGPGHPQAIAQADRIAREQLHRQQAIERSQVNGRKWKGDGARTPDDLRASNINFILERLVGWSPIKMNNADEEPYPFSQENARSLLADPRKGALYQQALDFVLDENSFTPRSAKS